MTSLEPARCRTCAVRCPCPEARPMPQGRPRPRVMRITRRAAAAAIVRGGSCGCSEGTSCRPSALLSSLTRRRARSAMGRYSRSKGGEGTDEGKPHEEPQACLRGVLTWWGVEDVRGVSCVWRSCPSHRRAPPLTLPLSRLMSGAGGSGPDSWFRLRAGCGAAAGSAGRGDYAADPSSGTVDHSAGRWWDRHRTHV